MEQIKVTLNEEEISQISGGEIIKKEIVFNGLPFQMSVGTHSPHPGGKDEPGGNDQWFGKSHQN